MYSYVKYRTTCKHRVYVVSSVSLVLRLKLLISRALSLGTSIRRAFLSTNSQCENFGMDESAVAAVIQSTDLQRCWSRFSDTESERVAVAMSHIEG